jgi:thiosulfate dehydrogenase (quinone) large subunit
MVVHNRARSAIPNMESFLLSMFILVSAMKAGRYGVDGLIIPPLKEKFPFNKAKEVKDIA